MKDKSNNAKIASFDVDLSNAWLTYVVCKSITETENPDYGKKRVTNKVPVLVDKNGDWWLIREVIFIRNGVSIFTKKTEICKTALLPKETKEQLGIKNEVLFSFTVCDAYKTYKEPADKSKSSKKFLEELYCAMEKEKRPLLDACKDSQYLHFPLAVYEYKVEGDTLLVRNKQ